MIAIILIVIIAIYSIVSRASGRSQWGMGWRGEAVSGSQGAVVRPCENMVGVNMVLA